MDYSFVLKDFVQGSMGLRFNASRSIAMRLKVQKFNASRSKYKVKKC